MDTNFKAELAAFARDIREICRAGGHDGCAECPLRFNGGKDGCAASGISESAYNFDQAIAVVEAYRKRKKSCAEVIDKVRDIYIYEVQIDRTGTVLNNEIAQKGPAAAARYRADEIEREYPKGVCTITVLSARRFTPERHVEESEDTECYLSYDQRCLQPQQNA